MNSMLDVSLLNQLPVVTVEFLYVYLSDFIFTLLYICCGLQIYANTAWPCCWLAIIVSAAFLLKLPLSVAHTSPVAFQVFLSHRQATFQSHGPAGSPSFSHHHVAQMC